ncbi:MAG TPA: tRNA lysidine(34) synthetase TilS [Acidisoma sp.]|jgi:tRNA(Ile)-lysidine synthase|uniref:tRNA lysidine(34) synthetase TilS n=1 Tax=Acidisoma sp. TaxID=1872115 RepID=UPI002CB1A72E|nr:tRNA lysidine(34) synthetase TilS [Acidisoma sp.]HTI01989.1 tRNA lysidine(34) synthetase TilS [Acidisoma sp.]
MAPLGPFGRSPHLGLAVSGGADSLCLALLALAWVQTQGGAAEAFIVDHGLRPESRVEALATAGRLASMGLPSRILTLAGLDPGSGMSERARAARYGALQAACHRAGILDLLLGHHAADQAETLLMRHLRGSGPDGRAGMAPLMETAGLRLLRPLLGFPPGRLRATLAAAGLTWAEDPTNQDPHYTRARLRKLRADAAGSGPATRALVAAAALHARDRAAREAETAAWLARHAVIRPEGFALLPDGVWPPTALSALLRLIAGSPYPPEPATVAAVAAEPSAAIGRGLSLHGVLLRPAGRLGPGFLLSRESAALALPVPARAGAVWDGRFRRPADMPDLPGEWVGALGPVPKALRARTDLPALVMGTLPAFRNDDGRILAVPALNWPDPDRVAARRLLFSPAGPAAPSFVAPGMTVASIRDGARDVLAEKTSYL